MNKRRMLTGVLVHEAAGLSALRVILYADYSVYEKERSGELFVVVVYMQTIMIIHKLFKK